MVLCYCLHTEEEDRFTWQGVGGSSSGVPSAAIAVESQHAQHWTLCTVQGSDISDPLPAGKKTSTRFPRVETHMGRLLFRQLSPTGIGLLLLLHQYS